MSRRLVAAIQAVMVTYRLATAMVPLAMLLTLTARDTHSIASFALALQTLAGTARV